MTWIESHQSLGAHPKTASAAEALKVTKPQIVGHLQYLWWWALDYAPDGSLEGYTASQIATAAHWTRSAHPFIDALLECGKPGLPGFLERDGAGMLLIHDWEEYAGKLIAKRAANAQRARTSRARHSDVTGLPTAPTNSTVPTVPNSTAPTDARDADASPLDALPTDVRERFQVAWGSLPERFKRDAENFDEFIQLAEDLTLEEINRGIAECRRTTDPHELPFPGNIRKYGKPLVRPAHGNGRASDGYVEGMSIAEQMQVLPKGAPLR